MSSSIFLRFVWKEYRTQRSFWLGVAALALFGQLLIVYFTSSRAGLAEGVFFAALLAVPFYILGAGAVLFAGEREEGTDELLRTWAAPPVRLFLGKLCFAVASSAALLAVMLALAWMLAGGRFPNDGPVSWLRPFGVMAVMTLELGAWSIFWSCLTRRAVNAACWAAATWMAEIAILAQRLDVPIGALSGSILDEVSGLVSRLPLLAILLIVDSVLVLRWLRPDQAVRTERWSWRALVPAWPGWLEGNKVETAPPWRRVMKRLLWQQWRQSAGSAIVLIALGVVLTVFVPFSVTASLFASALPIPLVATLIGALAFQGEHTDRRFTFLANRGIAPPGVWLAKQLVGLIWAGIAVAVVAVVSELLLKAEIRFGLTIPNGSLPFRFAEAMALARAPENCGSIVANPTDFYGSLLQVVVLCFAAGQFVSVFIPRSVPAGFIALVLMAISFAWTLLMAVFRVPTSIGIAPVIVAFFAASYFRTNEWLLERHHRRGWFAVIAAFLLPMCVMVAGTATFRVTEIPRLRTPIDTEPLVTTPIASDEQATADLYRAAIAKLAPFNWQMHASSDGPSAFDGWEKATPAQKEWFNASQAALPIALLAAQRPNCVLKHPSEVRLYDKSSNTVSMDLLIRLILLSARQLEADGKLDDAFERYAAALRVAQHFASRADDETWWIANSKRATIFDWMMAWVAHPKQTSQRLAVALRRLQNEMSSFPSPKDAIKTSYLAQRTAFAGDWKWMRDVLPADVALPSVKLVGLFPWERYRTLRLVDQIAADRLHMVSNIETLLSRSDGALAARKWEWDERDHQTGVAHWSRLSLPPRVLPLTVLRHVADSMVYVETTRRALLLRTALVAYRSEHGRLPERLDELVGPYFDQMPLDPWSGRAFGYEPKGFTNPIVFGRPSSFVAKPGQPLLWSAGPGDARIVPRKSAKAKRADYVLTRHFWVGEEDELARGLLGIAFPIP